MTQSLLATIEFETFLAEYGDSPRYELIDGELVDMEPTGPHEQVAGYLNLKLNLAIDWGGWPSFIPLRCLIKPLEPTTAFRPDVIVLDRSVLQAELL